MRKEVIIAIFAGLTIGLLLAFGIYRVNSSTPPNDPSNSQAQNNQNLTNTNSGTNQQIKLSLANIEDGTIFTDSPITIEGLTTAGNTVVVSTPSEDYMFKSQIDGSFSQEIKPSTGVNVVTVMSYNPSTQSTETITNTIVYYPDFEKDLNLNGN